MTNEESERITTSQDVISRLHDKIDEQEARIAELEERLEIDCRHPYDGIAARDVTIKALDERIAELESQLDAIGAGGVEPPRKQEAAPHAAQGMDMVNCKSGNWLTVVYRDIRPGDEARTIGEHPKVSALSWSHALNDRDAAIAAQAKQGERP